ncbi:hypothetical protein [Chitinophaga sp. 212800010-3]|uniref:hypothetical protein n=1 Tax=unclassified Chitinophaga TaxID=2619133 RepID=UPI002DEC7442|nr:hypothetical protein [Chitinophaga sp. 212800010-3]
MLSEIKKLVHLIEKKLDWGEGNGWQIRDFENLRDLITDKTGVTLSTATLRRVWGRLSHNHLPSTTTLDALANFAGVESWRAFLKLNTDDSEPVPIPGKRRSPIRNVLLLTLTIIVAGILTLLVFRKENLLQGLPKPGDYSFSHKQLTHELPNTVVFTYDARAATTDSIFIQQDWDPNSRVRVEKNGHTHTSIYYEPAFYHPLLIIGKQTVKAHPLMISTKGWLGLIKNKPVPVYLDSASFVQPDALRVSVAEIQRLVPQMETVPPILRYYNVGNFDPVPVNHFSFSATLKHEYNKGAAACQFSDIVLLTDDAPIVIPLSAKGCVSELALYAVNHIASGKTTDLSAFGVDFSNWVKVSCKNDSNSIRFYINDKFAYQCPAPAAAVNIVGLEFAFRGAGAVKNIRLGTTGRSVFDVF